MDTAMPQTPNENRQELDRLLEEGRKRGYVKRAELEAIFRKLAPDGQVPAQLSAHAESSDGKGENTEHAPDIEELNDLDAAVEQLLAADVDIVDDDEDEARAQEDEAIGRDIHAMETDSAPLIDMPDIADASSARLRRVQAVANAAERGEAAE